MADGQVVNKVTVRLPDGTVREYPRGTTVREVAQDLGGRIAQEALVARVNGRLVDLFFRLEEDAEIELLTPETEAGLEVLRHSTAHVMAQAVKRLFPEARLAIGPPIENGFYYDFDLPRPLTPEDLEKIAAEMRRIINEDYAFSRQEMDREEAIRFFRDRGETYKVEILEELDDPRPSLYQQGEFIDLCRGPHIPSTGRIKAFALRSVAGAYWRGDSKRPMLQRIYGTAFPTQEELDRYLEMLAEAERRDHRRLGRELDLFSFREEAPGFVFWHPKGYQLYRTLVDFSRELQEPRGYLEVSTPWIYRTTLWETSGHWQHYKDNMFLIDAGGERMGVKPMNCPGHCLLYSQKVHSYRDLPVKFAEYGPLARFEASGTLHGALRVRGMHQDDAHIFLREDQIEEQIREVLELVDAVYSAFGMKYTIKLSTRPDEYMGSLETWEKAEAALVRALEAAGREYTVNPKDGAFYGPKLDFDVTDALGRKWQCATVQLDFQFPERFDLYYVDRDGSHKRPVMIHRAIMGTLERFIGILVEHFAGAFPVWLAPVQVRVLPIGSDHVAYAAKVREELVKAGIRAELDDRNEKIGYKIRDAQVQKVPYMLVVGSKEVEAGTVAVRHRRAGDQGSMPLAAFIERIRHEIETRSLD
ncbi:MAG: threonine--tRNA ligase [Bacillota bacterium]|nr:threonine--tRNA ligase [Bacillota bacterium]REJ37052.1 MAG: threonine--tRNA ligase [Bacillota bacterium]